MRPRPVLQSFNFAIDGIIHALRTQRNMRIHFSVAIVVLTLSLVLGVSTVEFALLSFAITLVVVSELINTALESVIDLMTTTFDPTAKVAKDVAAASVLLSAFVAVVIGYIVFFSKLNPLTLRSLNQVRRTPIHLTAIALFLVVIIVIAAKAWTGTGTFLRGGWPSGHSAIAGVLFTAIAFISRDALAATLAFVMVVLVLQSRMEARFHTYTQVVAGAAIGILVTILIFQIFFRG